MPIVVILAVLSVITQARPFHAVNQVQSTLDYQVIFSDDGAWLHLETMMSFNPRHPGTAGINQTREYIKDTLESRGASIITQNFTVAGISCQNIIGKWEPANTTGTCTPITIFASHYDARARADRDPDISKRSEPVPAANDGGSSTALLLELATAINAIYANTTLDVQRETWLAFFDAEDQGSGGMPGFDWIEGSTRLALDVDAFTGPSKHVDTLVLVDMIGDDDLDIDDELYSDRELLGNIFSIGRCLGYVNAFTDKPVARHIIDDHLPFRNLGITVADVIDLDYPEWHTVSDDLQHVSKASIGAVGSTIEALAAISLLDNYNLSVHDPSTGGTWTASGCTTGTMPNLFGSFMATWWPMFVIAGAIATIAIVMHGKTKERHPHLDTRARKLV